MAAIRCRSFRGSLLLSGLLAACLLYAVPVRAQNDDWGENTNPNYRTDQNTPLPDDTQGDQNRPVAPPSTDQKTQGPVRLARFAYVSGDVTWRPDSSMDWAPATVNLPIREGAQIWVNHGGRADLQFDDGSDLRLGNGALITLKLLYSDAEGEFTQITLNDGLATLYARHGDSVYQIDTPVVAMKTTGPSQVRLGVDSGSEIAVQRGSASIEGKQGKVTLHQDDYLYVEDGDAPYNVRALPRPDSWDRWNDERDRQVDNRSSHLPPNIGQVAGDLDAYGTWREDPRYGWVWCPRVTSSDWRPYYDGHWTWVEPFGWTWVGNEPWGWAPYHYGTWIDQPYGWVWVPGPATQCWSPAVVGFSVYGGDIAWAPLCPWEVRYPAAFGLGIWGGGWGLSFSIGWAGCYYPGAGAFFVGLGFDTFGINHFRFDRDRFHDFHDFHDFHGFNHNTLLAGHHFVPFNASHGGASFASAGAFGGHGSYRPVPRGNTAFFSRGQLTGAPARGQGPLSGPPSVAPSRQALTPTRTFASGARPQSSVLQRSVYHASLPTSVQRNLSPTERSLSASGAQPRTSATAPSRIAQGSTGRTRSSFEGRTPGSLGNTRSSESYSARSLRPGTSNDIGSARSFSGYSSSAAEAARQARESLGMSGRSSGNGGRSSSERSSFGGYSGSERSSGRYSGSSSGSSNYGGRYSSPSGSSGYSGRYSNPSGSSSYSGRYSSPSGRSNGGSSERAYSSGRNSYGGGSGSHSYGSSGPYRVGPSYRGGGGYSSHSYGGSSGGGRSGGGYSGGHSGGGGHSSSSGNGRGR